MLSQSVIAPMSRGRDGNRRCGVGRRSDPKVGSESGKTASMGQKTGG